MSKEKLSIAAIRRAVDAVGVSSSRNKLYEAVAERLGTSPEIVRTYASGISELGQLFTAHARSPQESPRRYMKYCEEMQRRSVTITAERIAALTGSSVSLVANWFHKNPRRALRYGVLPEVQARAERVRKRAWWLVCLNHEVDTMACLARMISYDHPGMMRLLEKDSVLYSDICAQLEKNKILLSTAKK